MEELTCRRDEFSLPPDVHYLNCAYLGPLPRVAQQAGVAAVARKGNPSTIAPGDFFSESEEVRQLFASLIGARDAGRVALIPAASYGVATVARNTPIEPHQNIVVIGEDFPSDFYTWRGLARRSGATLRVVSAPDVIPRAAKWNERVLESIDGQTAVVAVPHVHWADGSKFDLMAIGAAARAAGAAFIVDGTQSVGALPFDVEAIRPDALICAGYKWLLGPYSTALAYYGERYDRGEPLEENWISRKGSDDFQRLVDYQDEYAPGAIRFDGGERSNFILLPMVIAALKLLLSLKPARIQEYCARLVADSHERMRSLGFAIEDAQWRGAHLFGLRAPAHVDLNRLNQALQLRKIAVSLRGSAIRVSPNVYNDETDFHALVEVLETAVASGRHKALDCAAHGTFLVWLLRHAPESSRLRVTQEDSMRVRRSGFFAAGFIIAVAIATVSTSLRGQAPGNGPNGPGQGKPGKTPGTVAVIPVDAGRPWGWATKAFMEDPDRQLYNTTKRKMFEGKQVFSQTITKLDVEGYCKGAAQYDFSRFEMQHTTMTFGDVEKMIAACPRVAATPILRVPDATETMVQHAVDLGVLGIIIPTVDDALESRQAAMFARFPPTGRRSTGGGQAGAIWGPVIPKPETFRNTINDNMLVTVMVETLEGVKNALEIASQPGVDVVIIGNADFESFSGFGPTTAGYLDLQTRVRNATYVAGKFWGNANSGFSVGNPLAADSRYHLGVPPGKGPGAAY